MNYQNGVMPTNEWFKIINTHVDFNRKSVVDYGCAEGVMCELAKDAGASKVVGIDNKPIASTRTDIDFIQENIHGKYNADIKIFSMIIHWIGKDEALRQTDSEELVFIYREPNAGYNIPTHGSWFPTLNELRNLFKGYRLVHEEALMEQDNNKKISIAIFRKKVVHKNEWVYKTNSSVLNNQWRNNFKKILEVMKIPLFVKFIPNGYVTRYVDGVDLDGDGFCDYISVQPLKLTTQQRATVVKIFKDIVEAGIKTNYTLADFTRKNVLLTNDGAFLIDYDVIIEGQLNNEYIKLFQQMIDYLKIDYTFDGNLKGLYENIY